MIKTYCQIWKWCLKFLKINVWHKKKRMSKCSIDVKEAAILIVWNSFYFRNRCEYSNYLTESSCYWFVWCLNDLMNDLN